MKIGILTFHTGFNHGGFLQTYSLTKSIQKLGFDAEVINYSNATLKKSHTFKPWIYRHPHSLWHYYLKYKSFKKEFSLLPLSSKDPSDPWKNLAVYDAVVFGSDVIWDFESLRFGGDPVYAGLFPKEFRGRRIAYAPSIGQMDPSGIPGREIIESIKKFDAISVRDLSSQKWLQTSCGISAPIVVDPTWLPASYELARPCSVISEKDILVYAYQVPHEFRAKIRDFAKKNNLRTVAVGYAHRWCDVNHLDIGPLSWVTAIRRAGYIISGTFHGTIYAIREGKKFVVLKTNQMSSKTTYWLEYLGLLSQICRKTDDLNENLVRKWDYSFVKQKIEDRCRHSLKFLKDALQN